MAKNISSSRFVTGIALGTGLALYHVVMRPWQLNWGATQAEAQRRYPGDELMPNSAYQTTRAITIRTSAAEIWPWLVQIGYQRGGFYSYDWLENLSGLDITSADQIVPEFQHLVVGDSIRIAPETPLTVRVLEPEQSLVLHTIMNPLNAQIVVPDEPEPGPYIAWTWAFLLEALGEATTRLVSRVRANYQPRWLAPLAYAVLEPAHFLMERKMLLGIRTRAESS